LFPRLDAAVAKRLGWVLELQGIEPSKLEALAALQIKGYRGLLLYFYELYTIFKEFCHSILYGIFRHFMPVWKFLATFWLQCQRVNVVIASPIFQPASISASLKTVTF
jgi:hypothetical protein